MSSEPRTQAIRRKSVVAFAAALLLLGAAVGHAQESRFTGTWPKGKAPRLTLGDRPVFDIGSATGAEATLLDGVTGVVRTAAHSIAIGDGGNNRVSFFDEQGRFVRFAGRAGDGPGEFRAQRWLGQCADGAIAVQDGAHANITLLTPGGELRGSVRLPPDANFDQVLWCSGAGILFVMVNQPRDEVVKGTEPAVPTALIRVFGVRVDTVFKPGPRDFYIGRAVFAATNVPLGREVLASAGRTLMFLCTNHEGRCSVFDTTGAALGNFPVDYPVRPVDAAGWQAALREHYQVEPSRQVRKTGEKLLAEIEPRKAFPRIDQVFADRSDRLWVRTLDNFGTPWATWVVLSPEGKPVAMVAMPRRLTPRDAGQDYLIGSSRDEDDVEHVVYYRLKWPG